MVYVIQVSFVNHDLDHALLTYEYSHWSVQQFLLFSSSYLQINNQWVYSNINNKKEVYGEINIGRNRINPLVCSNSIALTCTSLL